MAGEPGLPRRALVTAAGLLGEDAEVADAESAATRTIRQPDGGLLDDNLTGRDYAPPAVS